ncbi:MAG TPA: glycosyl hydrolase family 18 protein, partial [Nannocystis sp.]
MTASARPRPLALLALALALGCPNGQGSSTMSTESSPTGAGDTGASTGAGTGDPTEGESGGPVAPTTGATTSGDPTGPGTTGATGGTTDEPGTTGTTTGGPAGPARIVGYFISWGVYDRDYHVAEIPAQRLTHVNYAFANLADDGTCILGDPYADVERLYDGDDPNQPLKGNFNQLLKLKQQHPHLRTLISVG